MAVIRKRPEGGDDQDWIFSYADLMSLLLCFFILLYKVTVDEDKMRSVSKLLSDSFNGKSDIVKMETLTKQEVVERQSRAFQILATMLNLGDTSEEAVGNLEQTYSEAKSKQDFKQIIDQKISPQGKQFLSTVRRAHTKEEALLEFILPNRVLFKSGSFTLEDGASKVLNQIAGVIQKDLYHYQIEIIGHSDSNPVRKQSNILSNWQLSAARASTVAEFLVSKGIKGEAIKVSGKSFYEPIIEETSIKSRTKLYKAQEKNRRVHILVKHKPLDKG